MIKALLIITALAGSSDYTTEMPSMAACLDARLTIAKQNASIKTLCVPRADEVAKVKEFFNIFMDIIDQLKEEENYNSDRHFFDEK